MQQLNIQQKRFEHQNSLPGSQINKSKSMHPLTARISVDRGLTQEKRKDSVETTDKHQMKSSKAKTHLRKDEFSSPAANYFTPRQPSPTRIFSDEIMQAVITDDSAFWNIEPDAFASKTSPPVQTHNRKNTASSTSQRFL